MRMGMISGMRIGDADIHVGETFWEQSLRPLLIKKRAAFDVLRRVAGDAEFMLIQINQEAGSIGLVLDSDSRSEVTPPPR